jgi:hypothetical protein
MYFCGESYNMKKRNLQDAGKFESVAEFVEESITFDTRPVEPPIPPAVVMSPMETLATSTTVLPALLLATVGTNAVDVSCSSEAVDSANCVTVLVMAIVAELISAAISVVCDEAETLVATKVVGKVGE